MFERGRTDGRRRNATVRGRTQLEVSSDESDKEKSNDPSTASDHPGGPDAPSLPSLSLSENSPSGRQDFSIVVTRNSRPGTMISESETLALPSDEPPAYVTEAEWPEQPERQQQDQRGAASTGASSRSPPATRSSINGVQASLCDLESRCEKAVIALGLRTETATTKCQELEQSLQQLQDEMGEQERRHSADLKAIKEQLSERQNALTSNMVQEAQGVIKKLQQEVAKLKARDRKVSFRKPSRLLLARSSVFKKPTAKRAAGRAGSSHRS